MAISTAKLYTLKEVREILAIKSPDTIYSYIKKGKLKATKYGAVWRVTEEDLQAFIDGGTKA